MPMGRGVGRGIVGVAVGTPTPTGLHTRDLQGAAVTTPSMFQIKDGVFAWANARPNYRMRPKPAQVLVAISGL